MPTYVVEKTDQCPVDKPWGVFNKQTRTLNNRCHSSKEEALSQARAIYASMKMGEGGVMQYLAFAENAVIEDDGLVWVEALPAKTWYDPRYGEVPIDNTKLDNFIRNFNENVRGQEITTDFEHGLDPSKGKKASGTYRKLEVRPRGDGVSSLWAGIELTPTALNEVKNKEWRYFSLEWEDEWTHPATREIHQDVIIGGALTNRPVAKGMAPINFSEVLLVEGGVDPKTFAVWSTAYVNNLPDSSFFWIEPGGKKDSEGKTFPRSLRHLPYKDANGNVDLPHVRNAIQRAPQVSGIPAAVVARVQAAGKKLLGAKSMAEVLTIEAEHAPEEHQEPGTGIVDPSINEDDAAEQGWRREDDTESDNVSDPNEGSPALQNQGGEDLPDLTPEQIEELRTITGIDEHGDVVAAVKAMSEELEPLREMRATVEARKKFAEDYPEEAQRLAELEEDRQKSFAKSFSESFNSRRVTKPVGEGDEVKDEPTTLGFSALVIDKIQECTKLFSEGKPTFDSFQGVLDAIMNNGVVDYGNHGSERSNEEKPEPVVVPGTMNARVVFAEKVKEIQEQDELSFDDALVEATKRHPKLAEAYAAPIVHVA